MNLQENTNKKHNLNYNKKQQLVQILFIQNKKQTENKQKKNYRP